jgi:hypothetical protein
MPDDDEEDDGQETLVSYLAETLSNPDSASISALRKSRQRRKASLTDAATGIGAAPAKIIESRSKRFKKTH